MHQWTMVIQAALAVTIFNAAALADDCATVKSALLNSGRTPHSVTVTMIDAQGKKRLLRQIQTIDNKYVQTADGKWFAMNIGIKDLNDDTSALTACRRLGSDSVGGESTAVYEVQGSLEGEPQDLKVWVSSANRTLKTDGMVQGVHAIAEYDFIHITPPTGAVTMPGH